MTQIVFEGKVITLTQEAQMVNYQRRVCYEAMGKYEEGGEIVNCIIRWELKQEFAGASAEGEENYLLDDEANACDWDSPAMVEVR